MEAKVFDHTKCLLGEGPLWHPVRKQLFWCDILGNKVLTRAAGTTNAWTFNENVSALGWISEDELLLATETALVRLDLPTGKREVLTPLEADNPITRSNDGRADPYGGFWIGTMGKNADNEAGAIYRFYKGELRKLYDKVTIPNAICFSPDGWTAYFTDTTRGVIMRQRLEQKDGWPTGGPEPLVDLSGQPWHVDGAVTDEYGNIWNAQWGGWRVACYSPNGEFRRAISFNAAQTSCPAFGGEGLNTLFCTSARQALSKEELARSDQHGMTFAVDHAGTGLPEHQVIL